MTKENRIRLRPDVNASLDYYIAENAAAISGVPGVRMDRNDVVSEILMNFLAEKKHYPPKYTPKGMKRLRKDLDKIERKETAIPLEEAKKMLGIKDDKTAILYEARVL